MVLRILQILLDHKYKAVCKTNLSLIIWALEISQIPRLEKKLPFQQWLHWENVVVLTKWKWAKVSPLWPNPFYKSWSCAHCNVLLNTRLINELTFSHLALFKCLVWKKFFVSDDNLKDIIFFRAHHDWMFLELARRLFIWVLNDTIREDNYG